MIGKEVKIKPTKINLQIKGSVSVYFDNPPQTPKIFFSNLVL